VSYVGIDGRSSLPALAVECEVSGAGPLRPSTPASAVPAEPPPLRRVVGWPVAPGGDVGVEGTGVDGSGALDVDVRPKLPAGSSMRSISGEEASDPIAAAVSALRETSAAPVDMNSIGDDAEVLAGIAASVTDAVVASTEDSTPSTVPARGVVTLESVPRVACSVPPTTGTEDTMPSTAFATGSRVPEAEIVPVVASMVCATG
jgi:hypothetical protein